MIYLSGKDEEKAIVHISTAAIIAKNSTCERSKCGSIVVQANEVIGIGFNSPPGNLVSQKRCLCSKDIYDKKVTDKTCCIHAEQRAMISALKAYPDRVAGSSLYFVRIKDEIVVPSGNPYCTICSKMALDLGIIEFILWHEAGVGVYGTEEYNDLSYAYKGY
jgi:deoxycytidylate deaminase